MEISGHSLGGALAQSFTESVMRGIACATGDATLEEDIDPEDKNTAAFKSLTKRMKDMERLAPLAKIGHITLYTKSAPKTSALIDDQAALLSHLKQMPGISVYHQEHKDIHGVLDPIVGMGESKLFSGTGIKYAINKVKAFHLVADCATANQLLKGSWGKGVFGDRHNGSLQWFNAYQAQCTITSGDKLNIPRTKRSWFLKGSFLFLNMLTSIFVKPERKMYVVMKRLLRGDYSNVDESQTMSVERFTEVKPIVPGIESKPMVTLRPARKSLLWQSSKPKHSEDLPDDTHDNGDKKKNKLS